VTIFSFDRVCHWYPHLSQFMFGFFLFIFTTSAT